jgi:hypothetical protein
MIPALLAAPEVIGGVLSSVASMFSDPSSSSAPSTSSTASSFAPYLRQAAAAATASVLNTPSGSMTPMDWNQMSSSDISTWAKGLTGRHVNATDMHGHVISGTVNGVALNNGVPSLNIGGHLVSLSQLNQISWSPAVR